MYTPTTTEWEILNATADDWENLEQIFLLLRPPVQTNGSIPSLQEVADSIRSLVETGMLDMRFEGDLASNDLSYVWQAWFRMSSEGRQAWSDAAATMLAGTKSSERTTS